MQISGDFHRFVEAAVVTLSFVLALIASGHAILYKRDSRAAVLWTGFIWLMPLLGPVLYFMLGINRIRRRAVLLRGNLERYRTAPHATPCLPDELEPAACGKPPSERPGRGRASSGDSTLGPRKSH